MGRLIKYELKKNMIVHMGIMISIILISLLLRFIVFRYAPGIVGPINSWIIILTIPIVLMIRGLSFDKEEHLFLVPKSTLQIIGAYMIAAYIEIIAYTIGIFAIEYSLRIDLDSMLMIIVNVHKLFMLFIWIMWAYLVLGRKKKKYLILPICIGFLIILNIFIFTMTLSIDQYIIRIVLLTGFSILQSVYIIFSIAKSYGYVMKTREKVIKRFIAILTLVSLGVIIFNYGQHIYENYNKDVENDLELIGKWEPVDFTNDYIDYIPTDTRRRLHIERLTFQAEGTYEGGISGGKWTNGYITGFAFSHARSRYIMKEINGESYLFIEWYNGDCIYLSVRPSYYVLKRNID